MLASSLKVPFPEYKLSSQGSQMNHRVLEAGLSDLRACSLFINGQCGNRACGDSALQRPLYPPTTRSERLLG